MTDDDVLWLHLLGHFGDSDAADRAMVYLKERYGELRIVNRDEILGEAW